MEFIGSAARLQVDSGGILSFVVQYVEGGFEKGVGWGRALKHTAPSTDGAPPPDPRS
jgi:hypothetical protein